MRFTLNEENSQFLFTLFNLLFLLFTAMGCGEEKSVEGFQNTRIPVCELEIYDSLIIRSNSLLFLSDYLSEKKWYLLYDYFNGDLIIVNRKGRTEYQFNRKGGGRQEYGEVRGVSFLGPDKVIVYGMFHYFIYSVTGDFIESEDIADKAVLVNPLYDFKAPHFFDADSSLHLIVKGSSGNHGSALRAEFYANMQWISIYNIEEGSLWEGVPYESNSPYIKNYLGKPAPQISIDKQKEFLFVLFPYDPHVYLYQLHNLDLIKKINLAPSFFPWNSGVPFSNNVQRIKEESFGKEQLSGIYLTIQVLDDGGFLTAYMSQLPESLLVDDEIEYFQGGLQAFRDHYLQLFKSGEKLCRDLPLPEYAKALSIATASDHIVLLAQTPEEQAYTKYYLTRISRVK